MKFLHLGDLHIGKTLAEFQLIEDQKFILDQLLGIAVANKVDAILIAGDVYDKSVPSEAAVKLFDYFLCQIAQKGITAFIISGNHDSDERMNFGSSLFEANQIYISAKYDGTLCRHTCQDADGPVNIYLMPFVKASQVRHFYPNEPIADYEDAVRTVLAHSQINPDERNILVAHQFVTGTSSAPQLAGSSISQLSGSSMPQLAGSESAATQMVGLVETISSSCFSDFDYVALGHIHSAQSVGRDEVRYAGSPLKYSLSEAARQKYATIAEIKEKGHVTVSLIPLRPLRDLRHIRGRMDQLLAKEHIVSPEDFIYATLTDEDIIDNAMEIFRQYYPNTVRLEYDNSHTREIRQTDISRIIENKTFEEAISDFYRLIYGCEISEDEQKLMKEIAEEVGISNETD